MTLLVVLFNVVLGGPIRQGASPAVVVLPNEAAQHLRKRTEPTYPRIAELAQVQGVIRLIATINEAGVVEKTQVVRAAPLLDYAAIEGVRQWQFEPFQRNGLPVRVTTEIEVLIPRASSAKGGDEYDRQTLECRSLLLASRPADAIASCDAAIAAATQLPGTAQLERMVAYQRGGEARLGGGRAATAVPYFTSELAMAERLNASVSNVWWNLARAHAAVPDPRQAKRAYERAESDLKAVRSLESDARRKDDVARKLQTLLSEFVEWLKTTGQLKDALSAQHRLDDVTKSIK